MSGVRSFPALGFDPAPGSAPAVAALAQSMSASQRQLAEALHIIGSVGRSGTWTGDAADTFLRRVGRLPAHLQRAEDSFGAAARELTDWQSQLASMQQKAQELEAEATTARDRLRQAQASPDLGLAGQTFQQGAQLQQAQQLYSTAVNTVNTTQHDLDVIIDQATRLLAQHRDLAEEAAKAIDAAAHLAPDAPGLFARLLGDLESVINGQIQLAESAWTWVQAHANAINAVGDMLATASTVLAAAAVVVTACTDGAGGEVAAALDVGSAALSAGALGAHGLAKAAGAPVSNAMLFSDGLGAVTFGLGTDAHELSKGIRLSASLTRTVELMATGKDLGEAATAAGVTNSAIGLVGDPSSLHYFVPRNGRQTTETAGVPGGGLLVGFENAWNAGSAEDRAAHGGR